MPITDITNPTVIKFLVESYDKTARLRMKWNNLNADRLQQTATFTKEEKGYCELDIIEHAMAAVIPAITRDHISGHRNKHKTQIRDAINIPRAVNIKKGHSIAEIGLGDPAQDPRLARPNTDLSADPIMRPVDPEHTEILYKDMPMFGRKMYLKRRGKISPEDKFYFNECSGWVYGWRLRDSFFGKHAPTYGKVPSLTQGSMSVSGPQPDPPHYKSAVREAIKCPI